jgi:hypothetical protein
MTVIAMTREVGSLGTDVAAGLAQDLDLKIVHGRGFLRWKVNAAGAVPQRLWNGPRFPVNRDEIKLGRAKSKPKTGGQRAINRFIQAALPRAENRRRRTRP